VTSHNYYNEFEAEEGTYQEKCQVKAAFT